MAKKSTKKSQLLREIDKEKALALFLKAHRHNWDDGYSDLRRILKDPNCDLGTVSLIYWLARPEYYLSYTTEKDVPSVNQSGWRFLEEVEKCLLSGKYPALIRFDPSSETGIYNHQKDEFVRELPALVYDITPGKLDADDIIAGLYGPGAINAAAKANNIVRLEQLWQEGADANKKHLGYTPLMIAARNNSIEAIKYLLKKGGDVNLKGKDGLRPLHEARTVNVVNLLLENGAKVDLKCWWGSALHLAAKDAWGDYEEGVLELLIERGAKPKVSNRDGATALHTAAAGGQLTHFIQLLEAGWELRALDKTGRNVLHYAVDFPGWNHIDTINRGPVVAEILRLGVSPDEKDHSGVSARMLADKSSSSNYLGPLEQDQILTALEIQA